MFKERTKKIGTNKVKAQTAFSLVEMLVALSILAFVLSAFHGSLTQATNTIYNSEIKSEAQIAAQQVLDLIRLEDPASLPSTTASDPEENIMVGRNVYQVVVTYCGNLTYCPPTTTTDTRHVSLEVSHNNQLVYEVESVFTKLN